MKQWNNKRHLHLHSDEPLLDIYIYTSVYVNIFMIFAIHFFVSQCSLFSASLVVHLSLSYVKHFLRWSIKGLLRRQSIMGVNVDVNDSSAYHSASLFLSLSISVSFLPALLSFTTFINLSYFLNISELHSLLFFSFFFLFLILHNQVLGNSNISISRYASPNAVASWAKCVAHIIVIWECLRAISSWLLWTW